MPVDDDLLDFATRAMPAGHLWLKRHWGTACALAVGRESTIVTILQPTQVFP